MAFGPDVVVVTVALRRRRLSCPHCDYTAAGSYDTRSVDSIWRHLDLGVWRLVVRARLCRLRCPAHGVVTEAVPFARAGSHFTRDFEDLVGYLATTADKSTICRLVRIDWDSVGRIITRVMGEKLDAGRLEDLFEIGVDEVSWRRCHRFLTLVSDHRKNQVVWGKEGRDTAIFDSFFDEFCAQLSDEPDRLLLLRVAVATRRGLPWGLLLWHDSIFLSKVRSLQGIQGGPGSSP